MATRKEIEIAFKGKDEGASGVVERLAQRLKLMKKESRMAGEGVLERTLSSGRGLSGAALDAAGLGIQSIVVEAVGGALERTTAKALELREAFREGKTDAAGIATELAKSLPLLGPFVAGFLNIRELITGEKSAIEAINRETEQTNKLMELQVEFARRTREEHEGSLDAIRRMKNENVLVGLKDPERTRETIRQEQENAESAVNKKYSTLPSVHVYSAQISEVVKRREAAEGQLAELDDNQARYERIIKQRGTRPAVETDFETPRKNLQQQISNERAEEKRLRDQELGVAKQRESDKQAELAEIRSLSAHKREVFEKEVSAKDLAEKKKSLNDQLEAEKTARDFMFDVRASSVAGPFEDPEAKKRAAREAVDSEIDAQEGAISDFRDRMNAAKQGRAKTSATLVNDRFSDLAGQEQDKEQARIQKNTAEAAATLKKMEEHLRELRKQKGRTL